MIKEQFSEAFSRYSSDQNLWHSLWYDIDRNYTRKGRYYHTLAHVENLFRELWPFRDTFKHWDIVIFAIAYHDIIYNTLKKNNEEKSAMYATRQLALISFPKAFIQKCAQFILATKSHQLNADHEINLFTDADLSVLGGNPDSYFLYCQQIRKEYAIYPDFMYIPGRRKVIEHFLTMDHIFKTDTFRDRYEDQARINLQRELTML
jgi:predicted metal-dependent HD superfamily phosphohydrolase